MDVIGVNIVVVTHRYARHDRMLALECSLEVKFACRCDDLDIVYILWTTVGAFDEASPLETCTAVGPSNVLPMPHMYK